MGAIYEPIRKKLYNLSARKINSRITRKLFHVLYHYIRFYHFNLKQRLVIHYADMNHIK